MTNKQIHDYIAGKGGVELLGREVYVVSIKTRGLFTEYDDSVVEPKVEISRKVVSEVFAGYSEGALVVRINEPPRAKQRVFRIRALGDNMLYRPSEVYLTRAEAVKETRRMIKEMTADMKSRLLECVKENTERIQKLLSQNKTINAWIESHEKKGGAK